MNTRKSVREIVDTVEKLRDDTYEKANINQHATYDNNRDNIDNDSEEDEENEEEDETEATEEIMLSESERERMVAFTEKVKRMCMLENQIKVMNSERKVLTDEKNELKEEIISYMAIPSNKAGRVNFNKTEVIYLDTRESAGSLTRKTLLSSIKEYYEIADFNGTKAEAEALGGDKAKDVLGAEELFNFIQEKLGTSEKVVLVRENRDKKKRKRNVAKTLSVFDEEN